MKIFIIITLTFLFITLGLNSYSKDELIIDSDMTFAESIKGTQAPKPLLDSLNLLNVEYYSFDKKLHRGQILVHNLIKDDVIAFFELAKKTKFPIKKVIPIVKYNWDDVKSMEDNNSSAFNFRKVEGSDKLSNHAYGLAIDINPFQNPVIYSNGRIVPSGAEYNEKVEGTFTNENELVKFMINKKFRWGGNWTSMKDYHHFDRISK